MYGGTTAVFFEADLVLPKVRSQEVQILCWHWEASVILHYCTDWMLPVAEHGVAVCGK